MADYKHFTRNEIDQIIDLIRKADKKYIDTSKPDSPIRQIAGESKDDINMYSLFADLVRHQIVDTMRGSQWVNKKGYTKIDGFILTEKFYKEQVVENRIENNNQIRLL